MIGSSILVNFITSTLLLCVHANQPVYTQSVNPTIIRRFDLLPGQVGCLPPGNYSENNIRDCKVGESKVSIEGKIREISLYQTPRGEVIRIYDKDFYPGKCSIYRSSQCPVYLSLNSGKLVRGSVKVDKKLGIYTVISYIQNGRRIFSLIEDRE